MKVLIIIVFNLFFLYGSAKEVWVEIIAFDTLNGRNLVEYSVLCNGKLLTYSEGDSNSVRFKLNCKTKDNEAYYISIVKSGYINWTVWLDLNYNCRDTIIKVDMMKILNPRTFPVFYFDKFECYPNAKLLDSNLLVLSTLMANYTDLVFVINGYCDYDEFNKYNDSLALKRSNYIRALIINSGADTSRIEVRIVGYKPYVIWFEEDFSKSFRFKDTLNQTFIANLSQLNKMKAYKYNRRVEVTVKTN